MVKEVGNNNFFESEFTKINSRACTLLLNFSEEGFSYSILENNQNKVLYTAVSEAVFDLFSISEVQLAEVFHTEKVFKYTFGKVIVLLDTSYSTLVPEPFFDSEKLKELLSFNVNLPQVDLEYFVDGFSKLNYKNIYVNAKEVSEVLKKNFVDYKVVSAESVLINFLDKRNVSNEYFHLHFSMKKMHCVYFKNKQLLFNNIFNYSNNEDVLYNLLNTYKQLGLNNEVTIINLSGVISEDSDKFKLLYKYIKHLKFAQKPVKLNFADRLNSMPAHYFLPHYAAFI